MAYWDEIMYQAPHLSVPAAPSTSSEPATPTTASTADFQSTPGTSPRSSLGSFGHSPSECAFDTRSDESSSRPSSPFGNIAAAAQHARSISHELQFLLDGTVPGSLEAVAGAPSIYLEDGMRILQPMGSSMILKLGKQLADGQWSKVYAARLRDSRRPSLQCQREPKRGVTLNDLARASETAYSGNMSCNKASEVFAAKIGVGRSAVAVLQSEARILTVLMDRPCFKNYVVQFYGYETQHKALVMERLPFTLEDLVSNLSTEQPSKRRERVMKELLPASRHLIRGLDFLHRENVIHGDIKPANILLRLRRVHNDSGVVGGDNPFDFDDTDEHTEAGMSAAFDTNKFQLQPVYCDFSAARFNTPSPSSSDSAGTYDFMAPELFSSKKAEGNSSFASDVYALGMTLLCAVAGRSPYEDAPNVYIRRAMAMQGTPLEFVKADLGLLGRMQEVGFEEWAGGALKAKAGDRWSAEEWKGAVELGMEF